MQANQCTLSSRLFLSEAGTPPPTLFRSIFCIHTVYYMLFTIELLLFTVFIIRGHGQDGSPLFSPLSPLFSMYCLLFTVYFLSLIYNLRFPFYQVKLACLFSPHLAQSPVYHLQLTVYCLLFKVHYLLFAVFISRQTSS